MWLHRITSRKEGQTNGQLSKVFRLDTLPPGFGPDTRVAVGEFHDFGDGVQRPPSFDVYVTWADMEIMIAKFCEDGQREAIALSGAMKLAKAALRAGWRAPEISPPQSN